MRRNDHAMNGRLTDIAYSVMAMTIQAANLNVTALMAAGRMKT